jgi:uncharacterized protein YqgC (DUF456 family)
MDWLWWTLALLMMVSGLAGTFLPLLPGTVLILAGALLPTIALGQEKGVSWWSILVLTLLMVVSQILDFVSGAIGAKWFGATRWGAIGGIVGAIVGIFFGLIGIFVGPLAGALLGELLGGKGILPAGKSGVGTVLGTAAGVAVKLGLGVAMMAYFGVALWAGW